jgi:hypothetical protein
MAVKSNEKKLNTFNLPAFGTVLNTLLLTDLNGSQ